MRVSIAMLKNLCDEINNIKGTPSTPYTQKDGKLIGNIGNYHLYQAYGAVALHKTCNEGGGVSEIFGLDTKKDLFYQMKAYVKGLYDNQNKGGL